MAGEFPTRETIESHQLAQLRRVIKAVAGSNAFYQKKLGHLETGISSLGDFTARFPFTTKPELVEDQRKHPPFGTNLTYPLWNYTRFHQTSGTTSAPLRWVDTPGSWAGLVENWKHVYQAAGLETGDRVYFAFSFGPFIGFWLAYDAAQELGCLCLPGGGMSTVGRARAIAENAATILCCTPTYALRLAEAAAAEGMESSRTVRAIIVAGEPGGSIPATRRRLEHSWPKARIIDHHGMTETGPVSYECPKQPGLLHVIESGCYAEVVGPAGRPVATGEVGELVLTTLNRTASPLLRYRTGDLVRLAPAYQCACGRHEIVLDGGILGRVDDMVIVRGVNVFPSAVEDVLRRFPEVAEFQAQVDKSPTLTELSLRIEPQPGSGDAAGLLERISAELQVSLNLRVALTAAEPGSLPRFEMKAKRWTVKSA